MMMMMMTVIMMIMMIIMMPIKLKDWFSVKDNSRNLSEYHGLPNPIVGWTNGIF